MYQELSNLTVGVFDAQGRAIEEHLRFLLQPKPRWWPQWFYDRMIRRLIAIDHERPLKAYR